MDHPQGHNVYESMLRLGPKFIVPTGDTVYYDNDVPRANTAALARYHWARMYSLPRLVAFHLQVPGYWEKDDHDTLCDDCWPAMKNTINPPLTFEEGQRIFREQVPMGESTYRTFRWGRGLQIWLVEGRDFRSANTARDGPDKTIWGAEQKKWLTETLLKSDADWRVLVSPTPIVGPDRDSKGDNHANAAFAAEGRWFRNWARGNVAGNFFVVCGDRHWQYHSVDPESGLMEFCCGPTTDKHAGGSPGENPGMHRFHRPKGGFLSATVTPAAEGSILTFRLHDVAGKVLYEHEAKGKRQ
jgi:alkaline phosphatase D